MPYDATLTVHSRAPLNAEPSRAALCGQFLTPESQFFVRCHGDIPAPATGLRVGGLVNNPLILQVADLPQRFRTVTVTATLQCAGNRRADLRAVGETPGVQWDGGAIGTAEWTGVRLGDVLDAAGPQAGAAHAGFIARDRLGPDGEQAYTVSIPLAKAISPEVILCWAMNGEALTPAHGAPLRAVVPGYAGVRSAKWLQVVELLAAPADSAIQRLDYKLIPAGRAACDTEVAGLPPINEMPVSSAICVPSPGAVPAGACEVRGWAAASGRLIARVDVSADGGRSWQQAALEQESCWTWAVWHCTLELPAGDHVLTVRAWDSAGQTQPSDCAEIWNCRGYLSAAWHRVGVRAG